MGYTILGIVILKIKKKVKLSLLEAEVVHRGVTGQAFHIF
jgi:hypothetical protein